MIRCFVAAPLPDDLEHEVVGLQTRWRQSVANARWTKPDQLHLTLAFLGDVSDESIPNLCSGIAEAVRDLPSFALEANGLGAFASFGNARVLWLGLSDGTGSGREPLKHLHRVVGEACREAGCPPADDRFSPHITLARLNPPRRVGTPPESLWTPRGFVLSEVVVFSSILRSDGPRYSPLARCPLSPGIGPEISPGPLGSA